MTDRADLDLDPSPVEVGAVALVDLPRGPGLLAAPDAKPERWGGRRAQAYVALTLAEYGTLCWLCGLPGSNSADHVIPTSLGGAVYDLRNLGPSHRSCNYARGNRDAKHEATPVESGAAFFSRP
jgi:hypothetical protein